MAEVLAIAPAVRLDERFHEELIDLGLRFSELGQALSKNLDMYPMIKVHSLELIKDCTRRLPPRAALAVMDIIMSDPMGMGNTLDHDFNKSIQSHRALMTEVDRRFRDKKARIIQGRFRQCVSNPVHPICQRRLMHEFAQIIA